MGKNAVVLLPSVQKVLTELGENIKLARLRRGLSSELIAERAGISRATLVNVEKGSPSVAMGIYMSVLNSL
ncbi:MAG: helix-turn-helix transcriptional regulator, partial [Treponema sp.]|nr:helix-turn-helix transcriptional regulator [Treponema sp.]